MAIRGQRERGGRVEGARPGRRGRVGSRRQRLGSRRQRLGSRGHRWEGRRVRQGWGVRGGGRRGPPGRHARQDGGEAAAGAGGERVPRPVCPRIERGAALRAISVCPAGPLIPLWPII